MIEYDAPEAQASRARYSAQLAADTDLTLDMTLDVIFGAKDNEDDNAGAGFTLVVQGKLISGIAITTNKWAEQQIAQVEPSSPSTAGHLQILSDVRKRNAAEVLEQVSEEELIGKRREYIHFGKALVESGSGWLELENLRVCLRDVSAWSFGKITLAS